jgi:hypothetical protein
LPKELKTAKVVVIGKPGKKDMSNPKSYRCISLLGNVAKLTEKAVAQYLTLEGEVHGWCHPYQSGSRPVRNTMDALMWLKDVVETHRKENMNAALIIWVPGHAGIDGNETADQLAKDAAAPENEEELPSEEDRCTSLSHLWRCTTDAKWKRSDEWIEAKCKSKKYYHLDKQHKPTRTITKTEKSTAQMFYQLKVGHALIGPHLKRIKAEDDKCWWCTREVAQSREHLFKHCKHWRKPQNALWQAVKEASGRGKSNTSMNDLFGDRRCSEAAMQFLRSTEVGRRF